MKKLLALSLTATSYLIIATSAFAAPATTGLTLCPKQNVGGVNNGFFKLCDLQISTLIGPFVNFLFIIAVVAALLYLVWGGLKWLTSGGDKTAVQAAREHILAAIIGLVIIFLSYFILNFILVFFLGANFGIANFSIPTIQ